MNFDFLKGLQGLGYIYENCTNAEKLAMTMPVQSVFASRKSAEQLAKFIYIAAHNQVMDGLSFADILADRAVRDYVTRDVLNAFHYIRKNGNRAVHGNDDETPEEAVKVLEDLHFVAGETAYMLGLIDDYPRFQEHIGTFPDSKFVPIEDVDSVARKMFLEYIEKNDPQLKREHYYSRRVDELWSEFDAVTSPCSYVPGDVDLNERLEFKTKPVHESTLKYIQSHFAFLGIRAIKKLRGELDGELKDRDLSFSGVLTIYGENGYTTADPTKFVYGILQDLPTAEGFKIESKYYGPSVAPWFEVNKKEVEEEFYKGIEQLGETEMFSYSVFEFLYNHGGGWIDKFENGGWIELTDRYTEKILDREFDSDWWCWSFDLDVEFDFEKHSAILNALHDCVRRHIPENQIAYCEEAWADGDVGILCNSVVWYPRKLRIVQNFLDEVNEILKPIMGECSGCGLESKWYITGPEFAVASLDWTKDGFKITGTEL